MNDIPFEVGPYLKHENPEGYVTAQSKTYVFHGRWTICFYRVITDGTRFFKLIFELPNTEYQAGSESDIVNVDEVYKHRAETFVYRNTPV